MLETLSSSEPENYPKLLETLRNVLVVQPRAGEIATARRQAEDAAANAPRREDRTRFCHLLSQHYSNHGELETALHWIAEARRLGAGIERLEALTAYYHASVLHRARRSAEALEILKPYTNILPEDDLSLAARIETFRAGIFDSLGRIRESEQAYGKAMELRQQLGDLNGLAVVYYNYAEFCRKRDDEDGALEYFLRAFNIDTKLNNLASLAQTTCQIALIFARRKDRPEAERWYDLATRSALDSGTPIVIAFVKVNKGALYDALGDKSAQRIALEEAIEYSKANNFQTFFASAQGDLGVLYMNQGRYQDASPLIEFALRVATEEQTPQSIGYFTYALGALRNAQGRYKEAKDLLERAIEILRSSESHSHLALALRELSNSYASLNESAEAFKSLSKWIDAYIDNHEEEIKRRVGVVQSRYEKSQDLRESDVFVRKHTELSNAMAKLETVNRELRELATDKDEFMAIAAHDLRNPLSDMRSMLQTLITHFDVLGKDDVLDICRDLLTTTTRMSATIHAFLEVSRTDGRNAGVVISKIDLVHLIHLAIDRHNIRAEEKGMNLVVINSNQIWGMGDASIVSAVLDNLISNAIKYAPRDTQIYISAFNNTSNNKSAVRVCDEGPGVPLEDREKLFTKYSRMSIRPTGGEDSLGIGLYLAKRMAERMGGELVYEHPEGNGSCFTLYMSAT